MTEQINIEMQPKNGSTKENPNSKWSKIFYELSIASNQEKQPINSENHSLAIDLKSLKSYIKSEGSLKVSYTSYSRGKVFLYNLFCME